MVKILILTAKMATPGLLKIKVFWNKGYYVIYCLRRVQQNFCHRNQIILWMWSCDHKFGNSSICIREVIITSIL